MCTPPDVGSKAERSLWQATQREMAKVNALVARDHLDVHVELVTVRGDELIDALHAAEVDMKTVVALDYHGVWLNDDDYRLASRGRKDWIPASRERSRRPLQVAGVVLGACHGDHPDAHRFLARLFSSGTLLVASRETTCGPHARIMARATAALIAGRPVGDGIVEGCSDLENDGRVSQRTIELARQWRASEVRAPRAVESVEVAQLG
ncbi:hypothetical protein [Cellulosimicrobium sp. TH-20]|uniref:hypothetical protein n=1 Tax=Cellulosimicrobium sp. TH-20 TaxID=1980001 RepID=UPI0015824BDF